MAEPSGYEAFEVDVVQYEGGSCPYRSRLKNGRNLGRGIHLATAYFAINVERKLVLAHIEYDIGETNDQAEYERIWSVALERLDRKFPGFDIFG